MKATTCPFCGVVTDIPHDTQAGCIVALQLEIARVRNILELSHPSTLAPKLDPDPGPGHLHGRRDDKGDET